MSGSLIPSVLDALVTQLRAALTIDVIDGPPTVSVPPTGLYVGATDVDNSIGFDQRWAGLGHVSRDETFEVPNLLFLRTGDTNLSAQRSSLFANLALIEQSLRSTPTLGISTNSVRAQFGTQGEFTQTQTENGVVCRVVFTVNVEGRI